MIPCYVSGKGMHATTTTWTFKTLVIEALESSGLGYDTRFRYYRKQFPDMERGALARLICDPIEYYDRDWPGYLAARGDRSDGVTAATEFMLERDERFRAGARAAIYCYDEAGFGSGVNTMRFLTAGKPVLGFYSEERLSGTLNLSNVLQLGMEYPRLFTLRSYRRPEEIPAAALEWLRGFA
ncbi:MAG: hypothetical protein IPK65_10085 [Gammaproteobacteria bacterium]|nr:hypothetical protein [Gammaproteobacteria bacterium]